MNPSLIEYQDLDMVKRVKRRQPVGQLLFGPTVSVTQKSKHT